VNAEISRWISPDFRGNFTLAAETLAPTTQLFAVMKLGTLIRDAGDSTMRSAKVAVS